jgi:hypothetical protein
MVIVRTQFLVVKTSAQPILAGDRTLPPEQRRCRLRYNQT